VREGQQVFVFQQRKEKNMSQHFYTTSSSSNPVEVMLGWDRPLGHFFLVVRLLLTHAGADEILYSYLHQPDAFSLTLDDFREALHDMKIDVPETLFDQVAEDQLNRRGNRVVSYSADGSFKEK
jgi:hypothetical protein